MVAARRNKRLAVVELYSKKLFDPDVSDVPRHVLEETSLPVLNTEYSLDPYHQVLFVVYLSTGFNANMNKIIVGHYRLFGGYLRRGYFKKALQKGIEDGYIEMHVSKGIYYPTEKLRNKALFRYWKNRVLKATEIDFQNKNEELKIFYNNMMELDYVKDAELRDDESLINHVKNVVRREAKKCK